MEKLWNVIILFVKMIVRKLNLYKKYFSSIKKNDALEQLPLNFYQKISTFKTIVNINSSFITHVLSREYIYIYVLVESDCCTSNNTQNPPDH